MIRIRFHGRGGHGVKTASRITGSAAFAAGFYVQDSPVYGAERRGAAVTAFTRIDREPILERGEIELPDLIVIGDETLLRDAPESVLQHAESASAVFVNTADLASVESDFPLRAPAVGFDVTGRTLAVLGRASALSAGLAAAAVRLIGCVSKDHLRAALVEEFHDLGLSEDLVAKNEQLAAEVFAALDAVEFGERAPVMDEDIVATPYDGLSRGTPSIVEPGNAIHRHTGSWRVERPTVDCDICTRCGLCLVRCPDGAIALDAEGYPLIDYDHCKGCMICCHECPVAAIERRQETRAW